MKAINKTVKPPYAPVTLEITFETEEELVAAKSLFRYFITVPEDLHKMGCIDRPTRGHVITIMSTINGELIELN